MNPFNLYAPGYRSDVENVAFSACMFHAQEIEDTIDLILQEAKTGNYSFSTEQKNFTPDEWDYIEKEVNRRLGYY